MLLTFLNNDGSSFVNRTTHSNGLTFHLTLPPSAAQPAVVRAVFTNPASSQQIDTNSQGSHMLLPNGNTMLGYGQMPVSREYGPARGQNTDVRWQARFGEDNLVQSYRFFKQEWRATPTATRPSLYVDNMRATDGNQSCRFAYVSWNGATHIKTWKVYQGHQQATLAYVGSVPSRGFETRFVVAAPVVQVAAIMEDGEEYRSGIANGHI